MDILLQFDINLLLGINNLGAEWMDPFWLFLSGKTTWLPLYIFLLANLYFTYDLKSFVIAVLGVALVVVMADQGANLFKYGVARLRPCHNEEIKDSLRMIKSCGGQFGFFSAHASNTFAIAVLFNYYLANFFVRKRYILITWASIVALSRVYLGVHFPSDIIVGALFGVASASLIILLIRKFFPLQVR